MKSFVIAEKNDRYIALLSNRARRRKILQQLSRSAFRPEVQYPIAPPLQDIGGILSLLRSETKENDCYVLSENQDIDGKVLPADVALAQIVGRGMNSVLYLPGANLGYYEGEGKNNRLFLSTHKPGPGK